MEIPDFDWNQLPGDKPFRGQNWHKKESTALFDRLFRAILGGPDEIRTRNLGMNPIGLDLGQ
jgi:hypothetical protein